MQGTKLISLDHQEWNSWKSIFLENGRANKHCTHTPSMMKCLYLYSSIGLIVIWSIGEWQRRKWVEGEWAHAIPTFTHAKFTFEQIYYWSKYTHRKFTFEQIYYWNKYIHAKFTFEQIYHLNKYTHAKFTF